MATFKLGASISDYLPAVGESALRGGISDTAGVIDAIQQNVTKAIPAYALSSLEALPALATPEEDYFQTVQTLTDALVKQQNDNNLVRNALIENVGKPIDAVIGGIATEQQESRYPVSSTLARFGGGMLNPALGLKAAGLLEIPNLLKQIGQASLGGATIGALSTQRPQDLFQNTAMGSVFGAAAVPFAMGISATVQAAKQASGQLKAFANQLSQQRYTPALNNVRRVQPQTQAPQAQPIKQGYAPIQQEAKQALNVKNEAPLMPKVEAAPPAPKIPDKMIPVIEQQLQAEQKIATVGERFKAISNDLTLQKQLEEKKLLWQKQSRLQEYLEKKKGKPLTSDEQKALETRLKELEDIRRNEAYEERQRKAIEAEETRKRIAIEAEQKRQDAINQQIEEIVNRQNRLADKALNVREKQSKGKSGIKARNAKELIARTHEGGVFDDIFETLVNFKLNRDSLSKNYDVADGLGKGFLRNYTVKNGGYQLDILIEEAIGRRGLDPIEIRNELKDLFAKHNTPLDYFRSKEKKLFDLESQNKKAELEDKTGELQFKLEEVSDKLAGELTTGERILNERKYEKLFNELDSLSKFATPDVASLSKEELAIKKIESLNADLQKLEAEKAQIIVPKEEPTDLPRLKILDKWISETKNRISQEKIKQAALKEKELQAYGMGDKTTVEIKKEITDTKKQYAEISKAVTQKIRKMAIEAKEPSGIDNALGLSGNNGTKAVEIPKPNSKLGGAIRSALRKNFMPIQNAVDTINQGLGNKVSSFEADLNSNPYQLINELNSKLGLKDNSDKALHAHIEKLFPDKSLSVNLEYRGKDLNDEQKAFLDIYQDWRKQYKKELESAGVKETKEIENYLPRRIIFEYWSNKEGSNLHDFITKERRKNPFADNDLIVEQFNRERIMRNVGNDDLKGYHTAADAVLLDIKQIGKQKAINKFFDNKLEYGKGHGKLIDDMVSDITDPIDKADAATLIGGLFKTNPVITNPALRALAYWTDKIRYSSLLGKPLTALKQLTSIPRYGMRYGIEHTLTGLSMIPNKYLPVSLNRMINDIERGTTADKIGWFDKIFTNLSTGLFDKANQFEGKLGMSAAFSWLTKGAKKGNKDVLDYLSRRYGERAGELTEKLKAYADKPYRSFDKDILDLSFSAARDRGGAAFGKADKTFGAINPEGMNAGVRQEFYKLQTWGLKNANTVSDLTFGEIKRGNIKGGVANFFGLLMIAPLVEGLTQTAFESSGDILRDSVSGRGARLELDALAEDRLSKNISNAYLSFIPFVGNKYTLDQLTDPTKWNEAIGNIVYKGAGSVGTILGASGKAASSGFTKGLREKKGIGGAVLSAAGAIVDPDMNKAFSKLPPSPITETIYNVVDPAIRGGNSAVEKRKVDELVRIQAAKPENKKAAKIERIETHIKAGVPESIAGTPYGEQVYAQQTNKNTKAYLENWKRTGDVSAMADKVRSLPTNEARTEFLVQAYRVSSDDGKIQIRSKVEDGLVKAVSENRMTEKEALTILRKFR